jgi:plastocyanin
MHSLLLFVLFGGASAAAQEPSAGRVEGAVVLGVKAAAARDLSNVLVFLVPLDHAVALKPPSSHARVSQKNAKFLPDFLAVAKGQAVDFPNDDAVEHNVFSFSPAKRFDLGLYVRPDSKSVTFDKEGPVFLFCSIHEWMTGVIYVAPNPLFAVTDAAGTFAIADVPPGLYMAYTWNVSLPAATQRVEVRAIEVKASQPTRLSIDLGSGMAEGKTPT